MSDRCLEGVLKVSDKCLIGVLTVSIPCPTSPTQLGRNFYLELEFDSGVDPTCSTVSFILENVPIMPIC